MPRSCSNNLAKSSWNRKACMTDHVLSFLSAYQGALGEAFTLPDEMKNEYELFDCLRETRAKSVYLVRHKADDSFAVLKAAKGAAREHLQAEYSLLSRIALPNVPRAISFLSGEAYDYFLRSYIEGTPLSDYIEKNGPFSETEAVRLILALCKTLEQLHAQTPPIIHRDIKPQNIILTKQRTLALIDFDAARHFHAAQQRDTEYLGTEATAAPEQFGYQQTDQRSDVYSTGILLLFLCTGSYERANSARICSRAIRKIIEKSTRFDPARRFKTIRAFRHRLLSAARAATPRATFLRGATAGLCAGLLLAAALMLSGVIHLTKPEPAPQGLQEVAASAAPVASQVIEFESPQIEQAVRAQLGFDDTTPLLQTDLDRVTSLYLFGNQTLSSWSDVSNNSLYPRGMGQGAIQSLADIPYLRNLCELAICEQNVYDLSPLEGMHLVRLALYGNQITDVSVIASLSDLRELLLANNPLTRIDALKDLPYLEVVNLNNTRVYDLAPLNSKTTALYLNNAPIFDLSPLLGMPSLQTLFFTNPDADDLSVLSQLTGLTSLEVSYDLTSVQPLLPLKNLTRLALIFTPMDSFSGIETLEQLSYLRISVKDHVDLTPLTKMPSITELDIFSQNVEDYSALFQIPNLKLLFCSKAQAAEIEALGKPIPFEILAL